MNRIIAALIVPAAAAMGWLATDIADVGHAAVIQMGQEIATVQEWIGGDPREAALSCVRTHRLDQMEVCRDRVQRWSAIVGDAEAQRQIVPLLFGQGVAELAVSQ